MTELAIYKYDIKSFTIQLAFISIKDSIIKV